MIAADETTTIGTETEISEGIFLREYYGGLNPWLKFQIGKYISLPQYAPQPEYGQWFDSKGNLQPVGEKMMRLPHNKSVFHLLGFGRTPKIALNAAGIAQPGNP